MLNFNVPRRARNHQPPPPQVQAEVDNFPVPPVMHIDATDLARTVATVMSEKDKKKYKRPRDVIEHAKKCGAYDFYGTLDLKKTD